MKDTFGNNKTPITWGEWNKMNTLQKVCWTSATNRKEFQEKYIQCLKLQIAKAKVIHA